MLKKALLVLAALTLSACSAIPVKTLYKLATTDVMELDPEVVRTATRMPEWIMPRPNGAKMELTLRDHEKIVQKETLILQPIPIEPEQRYLSLEAKKGFKLYAYRINSRDIARLEAFRADVKAKKAQGLNVKGSLGIAVDACRKGELPEEAILVTNYLRLDNQSDYLPLVVDYDLRRSLNSEGLEKLLPAC